MPGKLIPNYLLKKDLEYELRVRGVATGTVENMRSSLAAILRREASNESFSYPDHPFTFDEDKAAVDDKLGELTTSVGSFSGTPSSSEAIRLQTQINHVLGRIDRMIPPPGPDQDIAIAAKGDLLSKIMLLSDQLYDKLHSPTVAAVPAVLNVLSGLNQSFQTGLNRASSSSPVARATSNAVAGISSSASSKTIPPHKWGIEKFSGLPKGISISAFFEMVEELRLARHVSEGILLESGIDLFSGKAYQFYKDARLRVNTWSELVEEFRTEYLSAHHGEELLEELRRRTQHPSESIGVYLAIMNSYFNRLRCNVPEETKLAIVVKNLHPFYQDRLRDPLPTTLDELRVMCRRMEDRRDCIRNYVEPNARKANVLERDLAFIEIESCDRVEVVPKPDGRAPSSDEPQGSKVVCFRCNQPGHKAIGCLLPKKLFCFKCKKEGVTVKNCPNCKQGNGSQHA